MGFLRCVLVLFEALSGLRVNLSESVLIPIGKVLHILDLAICGVDYLSSSYLGLPLGVPFKCNVGRKPIVDRFHKELAGRKSKLLSRGGRLTL